MKRWSILLVTHFLWSLELLNLLVRDYRLSLQFSSPLISFLSNSVLTAMKSSHLVTRFLWPVVMVVNYGGGGCMGIGLLNHHQQEEGSVMVKVVTTLTQMVESQLSGCHLALATTDEYSIFFSGLVRWAWNFATEEDCILYKRGFLSLTYSILVLAPIDE